MARFLARFASRGVCAFGVSTHQTAESITRSQRGAPNGDEHFTTGDEHFTTGDEHFI